MLLSPIGEGICIFEVMISRVFVCEVNYLFLQLTVYPLRLRLQMWSHVGTQAIEAVFVVFMF